MITFVKGNSLTPTSAFLASECHRKCQLSNMAWGLPFNFEQRWCWTMWLSHITSPAQIRLLGLFSGTSLESLSFDFAVRRADTANSLSRLGAGALSHCRLLTPTPPSFIQAHGSKMSHPRANGCNLFVDLPSLCPLSLFFWRGEKGIPCLLLMYL